MQNFIYIVAVSSLAGNAVATGSVLMRGGTAIIQDNIITLMIETIFFLGLALVILIKLLDKVIRKREDRRYEGFKESNRQKRRSKRQSK